MKTVTIQGHRVQYFDGDITELPAKRFQKFNKFILLETGIGSDMQDVDNHIERLRIYMTKDPDKAAIELENMRQNLYLILKEITPKHLAFCTLIYKLDGKPTDDLTDDGIRELFEKINHLPASWFQRMFETIKKKWMLN